MASLFDLDRIQAEARIASLEHHQEISSTNDRAIEFARNLNPQSELVFPRLILADQQTAGRGQRSRKWVASAGSLTFTLCLHCDARDDRRLEDRSVESSADPDVVIRAKQTRPGIDPAFALFAGLAVCEAVDPFLDGDRLQLKWPNDVILRGSKLAGILVEQIALGAGTVTVHSSSLPSSLSIVGIGLNANNEPNLATITDDLDERSQHASITPPISLRTTFDRQFDLTSLAISITNRVIECHQPDPLNRVHLLAACERRMIFLDREITVLLPSKQLVHGRFVGLSDLGELRLQHKQAETRIQSGSIVTCE